MPKIYFYKLTADNGGAPCVEGGLLSLAICKPMIRSTAEAERSGSDSNFREPSGSDSNFPVASQMLLLEKSSLTLRFYCHRQQRSHFFVCCVGVLQMNPNPSPCPDAPEQLRIDELPEATRRWAPRQTVKMMKKRPTRFENIDFLVKGNGDVTIGRVGPVRCSAVAADDNQQLAALVRRPRESLEDLLARLDAALEKAWNEDVFVDEING